MIVRAAVGARARGARTALDAALAGARGPLVLGDHGAHGWWVDGDAAEIDPLAARWAAALGASVRLYVARASADGVEVRGWVVDADDARRGLEAVTDDDRTPWDGETPLVDLAEERLAIVLEMFEELHHEDAHHETWP